MAAVEEGKSGDGETVLLAPPLDTFPTFAGHT